MTKDKTKIRKAILANHGGLGEAGDTQIMTIWNSLDEQTQKKYMEKLKEKKDAVNIKS